MCHRMGQFFTRKKTRDMYAVDKWTRMLIKSLLETNRKMWKERCDILHVENEYTYNKRRRDEIWNLCLYLRKNNSLIPFQDQHLLHKPYSFFARSPLDNVLNWEKGIQIKLRRFKIPGNGDIRKNMVGINGNGRNENTECRKRAIENVAKINTQDNEREHQDESRKSPRSTVHLSKHDECTWMYSGSPWKNVSDRFKIRGNANNECRKRKLNVVTMTGGKEDQYEAVNASEIDESQKASSSPVDMSKHDNCTGVSLSSHGTNESDANPDMKNNRSKIMEVGSDVTDESWNTSQDEDYEDVPACGQDESRKTSISTVDTRKHENCTGKCFGPHRTNANNINATTQNKRSGILGVGADSVDASWNAPKSTINMSRHEESIWMYCSSHDRAASTDVHLKRK